MSETETSNIIEIRGPAAAALSGQALAVRAKAASSFLVGVAIRPLKQMEVTGVYPVCHGADRQSIPDFCNIHIPPPSLPRHHRQVHGRQPWSHNQPHRHRVLDPRLTHGHLDLALVRAHGVATGA